MTNGYVRLVTGVIALLIAAGAPANARDRDPGAALTPWGSPDLRGTYVGPYGARKICTTHDGMVIVAPLSEGVTQIGQSAKHVLIRNQFDRRSRMLTFEARAAGSEGFAAPDARLRWEGETLVIDSAAVPWAGRIRHATPAADFSHDAEVIERFTRLDDDTLAYEFAINGSALSDRSCTIRFPLTRVSIRK